MDFVEAAVIEIEASLEFLGRLRGDKVDCTAGRVLAEQGALRALEHFDTLEIIKRVPREHREGHGRLIEREAHCGINAERVCVEADSAQGEDRRSVRGWGKREVRNRLGQFIQPHNAAPFEQ